MNALFSQRLNDRGIALGFVLRDVSTAEFGSIAFCSLRIARSNRGTKKTPA
jgi:hypothetical protein